MANADQPFGFMPIGTTDGSDYHGKLVQVQFLAADTTAVYIGDFVTASANGANTTGTIPAVKLATAGTNNPVMGALVSLTPDFTDEGTLTTKYRVASSVRTGFVAAGTQVLYVAQEDSDSSNLAAADMNLNVNMANTAGSTITGQSAQEIDSSSKATGATLQLRLHHLYDVPGNAIGTNANWVVSVNRSDQVLAGAGI